MSNEATRDFPTPFHAYTRLATGAFAGVIVYTLLFKLPGGELADDWMHTLLHLAWGAFGAYAGWFALQATAARAFTFGTICLYGALLAVGLSGNGLFMEAEHRIPLDPAANVFHGALFLIGLTYATRAWRSTDEAT